MTLSIRVGGRYRTWDGEEVEIFCFDPSWSRFPYKGRARRQGSALLSWDARGRFAGGGAPHRLDLVSEITEPAAPAAAHPDPALAAAEADAERLAEALRDLAAEVRSDGVFADWPDLKQQVDDALSAHEARKGDKG